MENTKRTFIEKMNPLFKILVLVAVAILTTIDFKPYLAILLVLTVLGIAQCYSQVSAKEILFAIKGFFAVVIGFIAVITGTRFLSGQPLQMIYVIGLSLRIIVISSYSALFVKTTDPTAFVLVLIQYFHMPVRMGYAFLVAYRFLPTFKEEMELIRFAHQVRGVEESKNPMVKVWQSQRYILPMMTNAIRRSIRISMAMETRAFGKYEDRTYYKQICIEKREVFVTIAYVIYMLVLLTVLYKYDLASIGLKFR